MKQKLSQSLKKVKTWITGAPNKKSHLDFIAGLLSIPVLLSVIILNYTSIQNSKKEAEKNLAPTSAQEKIIVITGENGNKTADPTHTPTKSDCKKEIGPISISYPREDQRISDNPVLITIRYDDASYCGVEWSYRINKGAWSDYNRNSVGLYNLSNGDINFELRVRSTATNEEIVLERNFIYEGTKQPSPSATSSGTLQ